MEMERVFHMNGGAGETSYVNNSLLQYNMAMERVLHMKGGMGETSYVNNSLLQRKVIEKVKVIVEENMKLMMANTTLNGSIKVADLGCSSGKNALMAISNIVNIIVNTSSSLNHEPLVFQIYLNDLFENDFNTIFKLLPDFHQNIKQECGDNIGACFVNATPGSFFGRLFPNNYINFFHSSYSVHWLSQVPKEEHFNKGNIYVTRTSSAKVYDGYRNQFERDFKYFLESRFEELAWGGVMVLTFLGRETKDEPMPSYEVLNIVLNEMVKEGFIDEAKLNSFNLPAYHPTVEEVRQVIDSEGSFTLQKLKTFTIGWDADLQEEISDYVLDTKMRGDFVAKYIRAIFEPLLLVEFGENVMDEIFLRFAKQAAKLMELETPKYTSIVLIMTKDQ